VWPIVLLEDAFSVSTEITVPTVRGVNTREGEANIREIQERIGWVFPLLTVSHDEFRHTAEGL
jgi:hypothetical protein